MCAARPSPPARPQVAALLALLAPLWALVVALCPAQAAARAVRLSVRGATFKPFPIAVPEVLAQGGGAAAAAAAAGATALLRADTDLARALEVLPPQTYLAAASGRPDFAAWADVGAAGLVQGEVAAGAGGAMDLTLRYFDVAMGRARLERRCRLSAAAPAACVHPFLDEVVRLLTGEEGIFSSRIAVAARQGRNKFILSCDVDGNDRRAHTPAAGLDLLPAWEPSGAHLFFTSFASGNPDLWRVALVGGARAPLSRRRGLNTGAAVSPDGRRLAVTLSSRGNTQIFVMNTDGGDLRPVTPSVGQNVSPSWSPDGRRIAFVSSRSGAPHIHVVDADGQNLRRLTFRGNYNQEPDWSPRADGQIAFTARDAAFKYDIFLVHPETQAITRLTQDDGHNDSPSHAPDGQSLAFTRRQGAGPRRLMIMDVDGRNPRPVANMADLEVETPAWGPRLGYP